ncbi:hypothetical protein Taro_019403, partial [Colocasia esculenta]|nr:hypothetical protein [Colocasia esculenta]
VRLLCKVPARIAVSAAVAVPRGSPGAVLLVVFGAFERVCVPLRLREPACCVAFTGAELCLALTGCELWLRTVSRSFLLLPCSSEFEVCGWFGWCVLEGFSQSGALVVLVEVLPGLAYVASV